MTELVSLNLSQSHNPPTPSMAGLKSEASEGPAVRHDQPGTLLCNAVTKITQSRSENDKEDNV